MSDYSKMTPDELRRAIAERLGWRIAPNFFPVSKRTGYTLVDADGKVPAGLHGYNYWVEDEAWSELPDWPSDAGVAFDLCLMLACERGWSIEIEPQKDASVWCSFSKTDFGECHAQVNADTPALALCHLWLAATGGE
jgi:hypothetical protein